MAAAKSAVEAAMPLLMALAVCTYSSHSILNTLSQRDGRIHYSVPAAVFVTELAKLVASLAMVAVTAVAQGADSVGLRSVVTPGAFARLALPAVLYAANNNIAYHAQREMDAASFVVLCNFKIVTTAILFRILIRRRLSPVQWAAMPVLVAAGALNGYSGLSHSGAVEGEIFITARGALLMLIYCGISGLAGVYSERVLKATGASSSIHAQNIPMYILGVAFNGFAWLSSRGVGAEARTLLQGFNVHTWAIVATQAANGILLSVVMKHASSIAKLFVVAFATALGTVLAVVIFDLRTDSYFVASLVLVIVALALYNKSAWAGDADSLSAAVEALLIGRRRYVHRTTAKTV